MDYIPTNHRWNTEDEIEYLEQIGNHGNHVTLEMRRQILLGYQSALGMRPRSERRLDIQRIRVRLAELLKT